MGVIKISKKDEVLKLAKSLIGTSNTDQFNCEYYGTTYNPGYAWCAVFQWWLFKHNGISDLFYGGLKTASCNTLYNYHKKLGQAVTDYKPGDLIFFDTTGRHLSINHVGICESCTATTMISIDGNTSGTNGTSDNNGGSVNRRSRNIKTYVMAAIRPNYEIIEEEDDMTKDEVIAIIKEYLSGDGTKPSDWADDELATAISLGITDGSRPQGYATRQESAIMVKRAFAVSNEEKLAFIEGE